MWDSWSESGWMGHNNVGLEVVRNMLEKSLQHNIIFNNFFGRMQTCSSTSSSRFYAVSPIIELPKCNFTSHHNSLPFKARQLEIRLRIIGNRQQHSEWIFIIAASDLLESCLLCVMFVSCEKWEINKSDFCTSSCARSLKGKPRRNPQSTHIDPSVAASCSSTWRGDFKIFLSAQKNQLRLTKCIKLTEQLDRHRMYRMLIKMEKTWTWLRASEAYTRSWIRNWNLVDRTEKNAMHVIDIRHSLFGGMKSHFWCSQNNFIRQMFHFYIFSKYVSPLLELFGCIEAGIGTSHIVVCLVCHWRTEQAQLNCRMIEVEKFTWRKKILTF